MPSPFPGMDPYIESQQRFDSFHTAFIAACAEVINDRLDPPYYASVGERILVDASGPEEMGGRPVLLRIGPDVAVAIEDAARSGRAHDNPANPAAVGLLPETLPQAVVSIDQPTQKLIEIRGLPDDRLITTVELLSPSNKRPGPDRDAFLFKRADLLHRDVNVVDLDLLLGGRRVPLLAPLPPGDYHAMVTRSDHRDQCEVYSWTVRDPLPTVAVPMEPGVADVPLDLGVAFARVYERFHLDRQLRYAKPLLGPWTDADRAWVAERVAAAQGGSR
jgi:hypothetical protein